MWQNCLAKVAQFSFLRGFNRRSLEKIFFSNCDFYLQLNGLPFCKIDYPIGMSANSWVKATGIPLPTCKMQGCCCRGASPSTPFFKLLEKAADGDDFARNFFSIFIPHQSHEEARKVVPGLVERTLKAAEKDKGFNNEADVVFYHCRFIGDDNKCQIWEDRPQLCRAYPDTPFVVFAPNCAFEPWAKEAKKKFFEIKEELKHLKSLKEELNSLKEGTKYTKIDAIPWPEDNLYNLSMVLLLTPLYLVSPLGSYLSYTEERLRSSNTCP